MGIALRIAVEPRFEILISHLRRGFLRGRNMIANTLGIDFESMRFSSRAVMARLYASTARRHSPASHRISVLTWWSAWVVLVRSFALSKPSIIYANALPHFPGLSVPVSTRQSGFARGAPSALALCPCGRRSHARSGPVCAHRHFHQCFCRRCRHGLAECHMHIGLVLNVYEDFALFCGLCLSLSKPVVVPLWLTSLQDAQTLGPVL